MFRFDNIPTFYILSERWMKNYYVFGHFSIHNFKSDKGIHILSASKSQNFTILFALNFKSFIN